MSEFGYQCEYCDGTVRDKRVDREAFKHNNGFVILEDVGIGVCDKCGNRYFSAATLKRVEEIRSGTRAPDHSEQVPVASAG